MSIIEKYSLTDEDVRMIVLEWYLNGLEPIIFCTPGGLELDEYIEITYNVFIDD